MTPVWLSLGIATAATLLVCVPAIAAGTWLARAEGPRRAIGQVVVLAPLVLPPVFTGWLLLQVIGRHGPLGPLELAFTPMAAVLAACVVGFPLFARSVQLAVEGQDPGLREAAAVLGASPPRVWATITVPLALPGIVTGALLCFARGLGEFGATILVAGNIEGSTRTVPLALFTALQVPGGHDEAMAWAGWSLALSIAALAVSEVLGRLAARRTAP